MRVRVLLVLLVCGVAMSAHAADNASAAKANLDLGVAYLKQGNLPLAKEKLERARDQNSRDGGVRGALGLLYARLGYDAKADAEFGNALKLSARDPEQQNNYAVYLCSRQRYAEGVKHFEQAAGNPLYKTPWAAFTNAGVCLRSANREAEAAELFNKALALRPAYAEATFQAADLELAQHKAADAAKRVTAYLAVYPATAEILHAGWRAARELGDQVGAFRMARRLQADFSGHELTRAATAATPGTASSPSPAATGASNGR